MTSIPILSSDKHIFLSSSELPLEPSWELWSDSRNVCVEGNLNRAYVMGGQATASSSAWEWPTIFLLAICFCVQFYYLRTSRLYHFLLELKWNSLNVQMIQESVSLNFVNLINHPSYAHLQYILNSVFVETLLSSCLGVILPHLMKTLFSTKFWITFPFVGKESKLQSNLSIWSMAIFAFVFLFLWNPADKEPMTC